MATGDPFLDFALGLRSDGLTPIMKAISEANSEYAYIVLIPLLYWVFSRKVAIVLLIADALGTFLAVFLKEALLSPRPPNAGETTWLGRADGYGFPSGHTTASATTWSTLAALLKSWRVALFGAAVTAAVGLSRMYLGVHYSGDVAGGLAIGVGIGVAVLLFGARLAKRFPKLPKVQQYASVLVFPALLALNHSNDAIVILCATAGACAGHIAATDRGWVLATGDPRKLPFFGLLRLGLGLPVLGILALALGSPSTSDPIALALRFTALGAFMTLLGPRVFLAIESRLRPPPATSAPMT
jgi:membrane-associated phospholipid phosphatase